MTSITSNCRCERVSDDNHDHHHCSRRSHLRSGRNHSLSTDADIPNGYYSKSSLKIVEVTTFIKNAMVIVTVITMAMIAVRVRRNMLMFIHCHFHCR